MKAAVINEPRGPRQFRIEGRPMPGVTEGTVLTKVRAFGLNRSELMTENGTHLAFLF